jgi:hypothetical protein
MTSAGKCPHAAAQHAVSLPGVPCEECRAFVDSDGSLMTADVARQRYPAYRTSFDEAEARWNPAPVLLKRRVTRSGYKTRKEYRFAKKKERREYEKRVWGVLLIFVPWLIGLWLATGSFLTAAIIEVASFAVLVALAIGKAYQTHADESKNPPDSPQAR